MAKPIIFVCEFITAGGFSADDLPPSLLNEGLMMRDALLKDIAVLNDYHIISCHDYRLQAPAQVQKSEAVTAGNFDQVFDELLLEADMVWLIAPETDGILLNLSQRCQKKNVLQIGCGLETIQVCSYKTRTAEALQAAGIPTLPVMSVEAWLQMFDQHSLSASQQKWIIKPEDGAGCDGIFLFDSPHAMAAWLRAGGASEKHICQPYQVGIAASFSMLCKHGDAWLLSCNLQHLAEQHHGLKLTGITLNALEDIGGEVAKLAKKIAQMLPDALGYVGVDVVIDPHTKEIFVIEINPRLTTSYVGLGEATGQNMANLVLACVLDVHFNCPNLEKNRVEITFGE